jgi:hypothetical protein
MLLAAVAAVTLAPSAANASAAIEADAADSPVILASSTCIVGSSGTCTTAIVKANGSGHFVDIDVNNRLRPSPCRFRVRDTIAGVIVHDSSADINSYLSRRLTNVYSQYQLELYSCTISARGFLDNT